MTDLQRATKEYVGGNTSYTAFKQAVERHSLGIEPGIVPFEFWVDGMAYMRKIEAGPCCFAIHAPGRALDVGTWIAPEDILKADYFTWWRQSDDRCPWAPHYPPRLGEENHIERARRRRR